MKILLTDVAGKKQVHLALETPRDFKMIYIQALHHLADDPINYNIIKLLHVKASDEIFAKAIEGFGCDCKYCAELRKFIIDLRRIDKETGFIDQTIKDDEEKEDYES